MFFRNLIDQVTDFHDRFKKWKPIHWCWWFEKHGLPIPRYLIGNSVVLDQRTYNRGEDDGDGTGGGGGDMAGGEVVVKAPAALQALLVPEPSALTFQ